MMRANWVALSIASCRLHQPSCAVEAGTGPGVREEGAENEAAAGSFGGGGMRRAIRSARGVHLRSLTAAQMRNSTSL